MTATSTTRTRTRITKTVSKHKAVVKKPTVTKAKATATKATTSKAAPAAHPTWKEIIRECIIDSGSRVGVSCQQIKKFATEKYKIDVQGLALSQLNRALASGEKGGSFVLPKGPSGKVKLAPKVKPGPAKENADPAPKKAVTTVKKPSSATATKAKTATKTKGTTTKAASTKKASTAKAVSKKPAAKAIAAKVTKAKPTSKTTTKPSSKPSSKPNSRSKKSST